MKEDIQVVTMNTSSMLMMVLMAVTVQTAPQIPAGIDPNGAYAEGLARHAEALARHAVAEALVRQAVNNHPAEARVEPQLVDSVGCVVGPSGEKVCREGAYGSDGQSKVLARGNKGPGQTGSNGNAGPISAETGLAIDPAAETYKKQIIAYQKWAEQQVENAKRQLGTAGK